MGSGTSGLYSGTVGGTAIKPQATSSSPKASKLAMTAAVSDWAKKEAAELEAVSKDKFGEPKFACANCTYAFKGKIKHNHSGWKEN